jgi:hypothetical protein
MTLPESVRRAAAQAMACALLFGCAGCGSRVFGVKEDPGAKPPAPATPVAAVQRLAWSWSHLDPAPCHDLLAADYVYSCTVPDSAAPANRLRWFREPELMIAQRLFVGGSATEPAADYITFLMDPALADVPDPRPGKDPRWHRLVSTRLTVGIRLSTGDYRVSGVANFFLARGDSARIPQELRDQGMGPDSARWWIERWDDEAYNPGVLSTQPGRLLLLGQVKALYLE